MNLWTICYLCKHLLELTVSEASAMRPQNGKYFVKVGGEKVEYKPDEHTKNMQPLCSGCLLKWFVEQDKERSASRLFDAIFGDDDDPE